MSMEKSVQMSSCYSSCSMVYSSELCKGRTSWILAGSLLDVTVSFRIQFRKKNELCILEARFL